MLSPKSVLSRTGSPEPAAAMAFAALPACVVPENVCTDRDCHVLLDNMLATLPENEKAKLADLHSIIDNMCVLKRHFVRPVEECIKGDGEAVRAQIYTKACIDLSIQATQRALDSVGATPKDIHAIVAVSCTGFLFPSLAAHLIERMGFDASCRTYPVAQWGCAGGGGGLSLAATHCQANPTHNVLFVCAEFCSLLYRKDVVDKPTMICDMLFGDAASGQVVCGRDSALLAARKAWPCQSLLSLHQTGSFRVPNSTGFMSYETKDDGWHFNLTKDVPGSMPRVVPAMKQWVIDTCGQDPLDPSLEFLAHTGGPRVLRDLMKHFFEDAPEGSPTVESEPLSPKSPLFKMNVPNHEKVKHCMTCLSAFGNIASVALVMSIRLRMLELEEAITASNGVGIKSVPVIVVGCGPGMLAEYLYAHLAPASEHPFLPAPEALAVLPASITETPYQRLPLKIGLPSPLAPEPIAHFGEVFSVVIIGGGPSGAVLANLLCNKLPKDAPPVCLVEKRDDIYPLPRADHIDSQSLRILLEAGLPTSYIEGMTPVLSKQFVLPDGYAGNGKGEKRVFAAMNAEQCRALLSDGGIAPSALFDQPNLEKKLWEQVEIHRKSGRLTVLKGFSFDTCISREASGDVPIEAWLRHCKSETVYGIRTGFIVACDGANSPVRRSVEAKDAVTRGVAMDTPPTPLPRPPPMEFDRSTNLMVTDVVANVPGALDKLPQIVTQTFLPEKNGEPARHFAIIPNPDEGDFGVCRFVFSLTPRDVATNEKLANALRGYGSADKKGGKDKEELDRYIKACASSWMQQAFGMEPAASGREELDSAKDVGFIKCQAYTVTAHNHEKWTAADGRVLFAGDAAHTMWPYMGQGLCAGIRDAHAYAWRLAMIVERNATGTEEARELMRHCVLERRNHVEDVLEGSAKVRLNGVSVMSRLTAGEDLAPSEHAYGRMPAMCVSDMHLAAGSGEDASVGQLFPRVLIAPEIAEGNLMGKLVSGMGNLVTGNMFMKEAAPKNPFVDGALWTDHKHAVPSGKVATFVVWTRSGPEAAAALEATLAEGDKKMPSIVVRSIAFDRVVARDDTTHAAARLSSLFSDGTELVVMRPDSYIISRVRGAGATPSVLAGKVVKALREHVPMPAVKLSKSVLQLDLL